MSEFVMVKRELAEKVDDVLYIMTGEDSYQRLVQKYGAGWWGALTEIRAELRAVLAQEAGKCEFNIESAAKTLAACMDYPWELMPEQGRSSMREHAKAIVDAASKSGANE